MILQNITQLSITTILNRGVPNQECISIRVNQVINTGQFGLMLGRYNQGASAIPYFDNLFWFGDALMHPGDWMFVYTGAGTPSHILAANAENRIYYLYWGKPNTLFAEPVIAPILFRVDAVDVLAPPTNQPQINLPP